jgi:hypothetical protein
LELTHSEQSGGNMHNENVIYDGRKIAAYSIAEEFCEACGWNDDFLADMWSEIINNPLLYDEFVYFLQTSSLTGNFTYEGYSMLDLYFYNLKLYNLQHDAGKNTDSCDKDRIVFMAFHTMAMLIKEPDKYKEILSNDLGMDF